MRESGEPMEFGIFDFYKVFSRAFVKGVMGQLGFKWKPGDLITNLSPEDRRQRGGCSLFGISFYFEGVSLMPENYSDIFIRDIMTQDVVLVNENEPIEDIFELFDKYHFNTCYRHYFNTKD